MTSKCSKLIKSGVTSRRHEVVSLQSFEHFDVIYLVDKNTDHGQLSWFAFYNNIDSFDV